MVAAPLGRGRAGAEHRHVLRARVVGPRGVRAEQVVDVGRPGEIFAEGLLHERGIKRDERGEVLPLRVHRYGHPRCEFGARPARTLQPAIEHADHAPEDLGLLDEDDPLVERACRAARRSAGLGGPEEQRIVRVDVCVPVRDAIDDRVRRCCDAGVRGVEAPRTVRREDDLHRAERCEFVGPSRLHAARERIEPVPVDPVGGSRRRDPVACESGIAGQDFPDQRARVGRVVESVVHQQQEHRPRRAVGGRRVEPGLPRAHIRVDHPSGGLAVGRDQPTRKRDDLRELVAQPCLESEPGVGVVGDDARAGVGGDQKPAARGRVEIRGGPIDRRVELGGERREADRLPVGDAEDFSPVARAAHRLADKEIAVPCGPDGGSGCEPGAAVEHAREHETQRCAGGRAPERVGRERINESEVAVDREPTHRTAQRRGLREDRERRVLAGRVRTHGRVRAARVERSGVVGEGDTGVGGGFGHVAQLGA